LATQHGQLTWLSLGSAGSFRFNPRIAAKTESEYVALMNGLHLPDPTLMDIAIPANRACGQPD
jgi:hypothetical protein